MSRDDKDVVWVEKEFAEKFKEMEKDSSKNEQRLKAFDDYMKTVSDRSRSEFKADLENLEEDVAIYKGLMLQVRQSFEKAKDEALGASYAIWENFEKEIPSVNKKVEEITNTLKPLIELTGNLNSELGKLQTWNIKEVVEVIRNLSSLCGKNKQMIDFLINNFKRVPETVETGKNNPQHRKC